MHRGWSRGEGEGGGCLPYVSTSQIFFGNGKSKFQVIVLISFVGRHWKIENWNLLQNLIVWMNVILWKGANVSPLAANRSLQTIWRRVTREPAVKGSESHKYAKFYPGEANKKITVITSRPRRSKKFGVENFYFQVCHSLWLINQEVWEAGLSSEHQE